MKGLLRVEGGLRVDARSFGDALDGGDDVGGFVGAVVVVEEHGGVVLRGQATPGEPGAGGREVGRVAVACQRGKACWAGGRWWGATGCGASCCVR